MQRLIDWWMKNENGSLRDEHFITTYVFYEPQVGGYVHLITYVIELRERGDVCAACKSPFMTRSNLCAQYRHLPHESYQLVKKAFGYDLEAVITLATQRETHQ